MPLTIEAAKRSVRKELRKITHQRPMPGFFLLTFDFPSTCRRIPEYQFLFTQAWSPNARIAATPRTS